MHRGHKRTHSANLALPIHQPSPHNAFNESSLPNCPMEIPLLLHKSSANAIEPVCSVESLHIDLEDYSNHLFIFGKGVMRKDACLARKREE